MPRSWIDGIGANEVAMARPVKISASVPGKPQSSLSQPVAFIDKLLVNDTSLLVPVVEHHPGQAKVLQHIADLARPTGGFRVFGAGPLLRARIQFSAIGDVYGARLQVLRLRNQLIGLVNTLNTALAPAGGCKDIDAFVRKSETDACLEIAVIVEIPDRSNIHAIDTLIAQLAPLIEQLTHGVRGGVSVDDIADRQLLCAQVTLDPSSFLLEPVQSRALAGRIVELHDFTCITKERVNARNADILATSNSMLAAIASASSSTGGAPHTWVAHDDHGAPLTIWHRDHQGHLAGRISLPMLAEQTDRSGAATRMDSSPAAIAATGQCTHLLPHAVAAVGLAQSLANLHAHAADAIAQGNTDQHARDLALLVGARDSEIVGVMQALVSAQSIRSAQAIAALDDLRRL